MTSPLLTVPVRIAWQLIAKKPGMGDVHGHIFKTEKEAQDWIAQQYVKGRYTYESVHVVECTTCKQWHIPLNGLMTWSCMTCDGPGPSDEIDKLQRQVAFLKRALDVAICEKSQDSSPGKN